MQTPLFTKLGIKPGHQVLTFGQPPQFEELVFPLPPAVELNPLDLLSRGEPPEIQLAILFALNTQELHLAFQAIYPAIKARSAIWFAWPKKASKVETDLSFDVVQQFGLSKGLVDNKVCSIDSTWSAVRFVVPVKDRKTWKMEPGPKI